MPAHIATRSRIGLGHGLAPGVTSCNRCRVGAADSAHDGSGNGRIGGGEKCPVLSLSAFGGGLIPSGTLTVSLALEESGSTSTD
jgi:hypothetical protein